MERFEFITEFEIQKVPFKDIVNFVSTNTTSPYLEKARKSRNKPAPTEQSSNDNSQPKKSAFAKFEKDKETESNFSDISEDKLNDSLDDLTAEDYEDFAGLGVDIVDYALDKAFSFMDRECVDNTKEQDKKKERLKIIVGKLFKKWGLKFSLELLAVVMLIGYGSSKWNKAKVLEPKKGKKKEETKIRSISAGVKNLESKEETKEEKSKEAKVKGLISLMQE